MSAPTLPVPPLTLTTLELAVAIASAVRRRGGDDREGAQVVLDTLRAYDAWFCRLSEASDEEGYTTEVRLGDVR
jgi:hypothetical protein